MKWLGLHALAALLTASVTAAEPGRISAATRAAQSTAPEDGWTQESAGKDVAIHSRPRPGSSIKEFRAVGVIGATPGAVFAVLDDTEAFPTFMPYTSECRVLKRDKDTVLAYQRLELPVVSDRDYTLRSKHQRWLGPDGPIYWIRWQPANELGPAEKPGVQRVNVCEGGWLLEPTDSGATRAVYTIYTDSGGAIPPMLANNGSRVAIRKVFEAIRKQVRDPKYSAAAATSSTPAAEVRNRTSR
jgi:hypothetical protein